MKTLPYMILTGLVVALSVLGVNAGPAAAGAPDAFASQARAAGLDAGEARAPQATVDRILAAEGGTQIAANRVRWADGGGDTTVPLPGEARARSLTAGPTAYGCEYEYFCTYRWGSFQGEMQRYYYCWDYPVQASFWSYVNNQTYGTRAVFKDRDYSVVHTTVGAYSQHANYGGFFTFFIKPC